MLNSFILLQRVTVSELLAADEVSGGSLAPGITESSKGLAQLAVFG
jgi:hypothetical protein